MLLDEGADLVEGFAGEVGDMAVVAGVSQGDHHVGAFVFWAVEDFFEELHGAWGVGEGCQAGLVGGGEEHAGSDADGFVEVVDLAAVVCCAERHDDDEPGYGVDVGFVWVGFEGFEVIEPAVGGFVVVEVAFDLFDGDSDGVFHFRIGDGDESPGLFVGT